MAIVVCQLAGLIGSFFTAPAISSWYVQLEKPSFNPPNWLFGPVWISLFFLMGISAYLIWEKGLADKKIKRALIIFIIQLLLNTSWSILFFGLKSPLAAFGEIIFLWLAILITVIFFYRISKIASLLLLPYLLWVSFASILNFFIWRLNL